MPRGFQRRTRALARPRSALLVDLTHAAIQGRLPNRTARLDLHLLLARLPRSLLLISDLAFQPASSSLGARRSVLLLCGCDPGELLLTSFPTRESGKLEDSGFAV